MAKQATPTTLKISELLLEGADFHNPRNKITEIANLAKSIAQVGLITPLAVWKTSKGGKTVHVVVDGGRRLRALQKLDAAKNLGDLAAGIPVRIVKADSLLDARFVALTGNLHREDLTSYELAKEMAQLVKAGVKQKDIAKRLSKSQTWVSRQLKAWKLAAPGVKAAWKSGRLPDDDIQSIIALPEADQEVTVLKVMAARDTATGEKAARAQRAKARTIAKPPKTKAAKSASAKAPKAPQIEMAQVEQLLALVDDDDLKDRYLRGLRDALRLVAGKIGAGELDKKWATHVAKHHFKTDKAPAPKAPAPKAPTKSKGDLGAVCTNCGAPAKSFGKCKKCGSHAGYTIPTGDAK